LARSRFSPEQIIIRLAEAEVLISQGHAAGLVSRTLELNEQIYHRWQSEYGDLNSTLARRLNFLRDLYSAYCGIGQPACPLRLSEGCYTLGPGNVAGQNHIPVARIGWPKGSKVP
jgi:hypothetical protein